MKIDAVFEGLYKTFKKNENRIVFAVCGQRGTGKSIIAKYITDRFKESGVFIEKFTLQKTFCQPFQQIELQIVKQYL